MIKLSLLVRVLSRRLGFFGGSSKYFGGTYDGVWGCAPSWVQGQSPGQGVEAALFKQEEIF